jgi:hypothetical protein
VSYDDRLDLTLCFRCGTIAPDVRMEIQTNEPPNEVTVCESCGSIGTVFTLDELVTILNDLFERGVRINAD